MLRCLREWSRDCLCGCHIWFGLFAEDTTDDGEADEDGSNPEEHLLPFAESVVPPCHVLPPSVLSACLNRPGNVGGSNS